MLEDVETAAGLQPDAEGKINITAELRKFEPDREALAVLLRPMFQALWHEALMCLESMLPERNVPGSADAKLFASLRHRILTAGNRQVRDLSRVLGGFAMRQVVRREEVDRVVLPGYGPFNLPRGVKMPSERTDNQVTQKTN